uniref:Uncharacterized protein n=1 Tax=Romanomermis culicivorax TaxID=13658 RepID=A0A915JRX6_ROMCU
MKKSSKPKLTVWKQPVRRPKSTSLPLELTKEINRQQITNMEETIDQVAKKFANSGDDSDQSQTMDIDA